LGANILKDEPHLLEYAGENLDFRFDNPDYANENLDYWTDIIEDADEFLDFEPHILKDGTYILEYPAKNQGIICGHLMVKPTFIL
jgi:hypothetical protein